MSSVNSCAHCGGPVSLERPCWCQSWVCAFCGQPMPAPLPGMVRPCPCQQPKPDPRDAEIARLKAEVAKLADSDSAIREQATRAARADHRDRKRDEERSFQWLRDLVSRAGGGTHWEEALALLDGRLAAARAESARLTAEVERLRARPNTDQVVEIEIAAAQKQLSYRTDDLARALEVKRPTDPDGWRQLLGVVRQARKEAAESARLTRELDGARQAKRRWKLIAKKYRASHYGGIAWLDWIGATMAALRKEGTPDGH